MWLLIDGTRDLNCEAIARTPEAAKALLHCNCWECVCFDHDLGTGESGYDVMKWMFEMKIYPPKIQLVTSNVVGRENMAGLLIEQYYVSVDRINWVKE
jgi:hypothetical protein